MEIVVLILIVEMSALTAWMIYKHYRRDKQLIQALPANRSNLAVTSSRMPKSAHYPSINDQLLDGAYDDRRQMSGVVASNGESGTPSARAFARRSHQLMFKKWSQERRSE